VKHMAICSKALELYSEKLWTDIFCEKKLLPRFSRACHIS
jgi:hypothetical protein